jgi:hypothetical protein
MGKSEGAASSDVERYGRESLGAAQRSGAAQREKFRCGGARRGLHRPQQTRDRDPNKLGAATPTKKGTETKTKMGQIPK